MAVQRNASHRSSNVNILSSSLRLCRDIYNLFFPPIQRDSSGYLDTNSRSSIQAAFSLIIHSVKWCDLDFCTLFHSFYQLHIDNRITRNFYPIIQTVVNSRTPIKYIILMYSRYVIFYTFPTNVAETLSYCLRTKFQYLYPRVLTKEDEKLYWTIGVYMSTLNNISSYSPPIFINGEPHPLVALRFKKFRFLMCLEPNCVPSFEILRTIPHLIRPLKKYVERMKIETKNGRKEFGTYIVIRNTTPEKFIDVSHERLADQLIPIVEELICQGQLFADYFSNKAEVCFPATAELKVLFRKCLSSEVGIICRCENKNCSKVFEIMKEMEVVENTKRIEVKLEE
ncbi:hypothetical protein GPJ56_005214 [Histomonas meleagridis]|uniref:uncharacterized protein n=1 Tax=Histomonas meleagridis TaxID=135588 RepID=UPI00355A503E|nr:hypothetical protein GPJ56_005214 [Histomonas meleagridis]KAH0802064.1 hypothetical protein GO595_005145 [Histomonas meleagridis]